MGENYSLKEPYLAGVKIGGALWKPVYNAKSNLLQCIRVQTLIRSMHLSKRHTYIPTTTLLPFELWAQAGTQLHQQEFHGNDSWWDERRCVVGISGIESWWQLLPSRIRRAKLVRGPHWWWGSKCIIPFLLMISLELIASRSLDLT